MTNETGSMTPTLDRIRGTLDHVSSVSTDEAAVIALSMGDDSVRIQDGPFNLYVSKTVATCYRASTGNLLWSAVRAKGPADGDRARAHDIWAASDWLASRNKVVPEKELSGRRLEVVRAFLMVRRLDAYR